MSIDTCRMAIKGDPNNSRKYKKDREGSIRSFCVDIGYLYTKVYQHVKNCPDCEPDDVLRQYITNRCVKKFVFKGGVMSEGLQKLAEKYSRLKNKTVDPEILREYRWRCGHFDQLVTDRVLLPTEVVKGLNLYFKCRVEWERLENVKRAKHGVQNKFSAVAHTVDWLKNSNSMMRCPSVVKEAARVFDRDGSVHPDCSELMDILTIADVLSA